MEEVFILSGSLEGMQTLLNEVFGVKIDHFSAVPVILYVSPDSQGQYT